MRMPVASAVTVSPGMVFLLTTTPARSRMRAAGSPQTGYPVRVGMDFRSTRSRWVFVPP
jgi:hypothetical protein